MRNIDEFNITQVVIARHATARDVRFGELMTGRSGGCCMRWAGNPGGRHTRTS